jgi:hypothetical protein
VLDDQLEIFNPRQAHHTKPKRYTSGWSHWIESEPDEQVLC